MNLKTIAKTQNLIYIGRCRVQVKQMVGIKLEVIKEKDTYTAYMRGGLFDDTIFDAGFEPDGVPIACQATLDQLYKEAEAFGFSTEEIDLAVQNAVQFF